MNQTYPPPPHPPTPPTPHTRPLTGAIEASSDEEFRPRAKRPARKKRRRSPTSAAAAAAGEARPVVQPRYFGPQHGQASQQSASLCSLLGLAAEAGFTAVNQHAAAGGGGGVLRSVAPAASLRSPTPAAVALSSPLAFAASTPPAATLPPEGLGSESYSERGRGREGRCAVLHCGAAWGALID